MKWQSTPPSKRKEKADADKIESDSARKKRKIKNTLSPEEKREGELFEKFHLYFFLLMYFLISVFAFLSHFF